MGDNGSSHTLRRMSIFSIAISLIFASQFYWLWRGFRFARRRIPRAGLRWAVIAVVLVAYVGLWDFNYGSFRRPSAIHLTWTDALLVAPFMTWAVSSLDRKSTRLNSSHRCIS